MDPRRSAKAIASAMTAPNTDPAPHGLGTQRPRDWIALSRFHDALFMREILKRIQPVHVVEKWLHNVPVQFTSTAVVTAKDLDVIAHARIGHQFRFGFCVRNGAFSFCDVFAMAP